MTSDLIDYSTITVRLAETPEEIIAAQRVRYQVFYEEYGATPDASMLKSRLDADDFDAYADHLVVVDTSGKQQEIVGTYRLLQREAADRYGRFYSSDEFDISCILKSDLSVLELGRSCVLDKYRARPILQMLWEGIANYITERKIDLMFGCASLHSTHIEDIAAPLSYLHHHHLSPQELRPRALEDRYVDMNIIPKEDLDAKRAFAALPPIIKGYLRLGGTIGDGAVIDTQFNTTDVCVMVQTQQLTQRYRSHYERRMQKPMSSVANTGAVLGNIITQED